MINKFTKSAARILGGDDAAYVLWLCSLNFTNTAHQHRTTKGAHVCTHFTQRNVTKLIRTKVRIYILHIVPFGRCRCDSGFGRRHSGTDSQAPHHATKLYVCSGSHVL